MNLKIKILIVILTLLTVSTGSNIYYSYKTFIDDKKAYLFDTSLKKAETLTDQINQELESYLLLSQVSKNQDEDNKLINRNSSFLFSTDYDLNSNEFNNTKENSKSPLFSKQIVNEFIEITKQNIGLEIKKNTYPIFPLKVKSNTYFIVPRIQENNPIVEIFVFSSSKIKSALKNDGQTINDVILDYKNKSLNFTKDSIDKNKFKEFIQSDLVKMSQETNMIVGDSTKEFLLSMNKSQIFDFFVISAVDKNVAFQITEGIIIKTILFALFLFGLFLSIGLIFSNQITNPIRELTYAAQGVYEGNYDYRENIKSRDEIKLLGQAFERMCAEIKSLLKAKEGLIIELQDANAQLDDYNKNLEQMVAERTRQLNEANTFMSAMINSLDQGLVVFDKELNIKPIYTKASADLFGKNPGESDFAQLVQKDDEAERQTLSQWAMITFSGALPFDSAIGLAPDHVQFGAGLDDPNFKYIKLNYYPMMNEAEEIENIVAVATDKTNSVISDHQLKTQEAYVLMILKILKNKSAFYNFIEEVRGIFENFKNCYNEDENTINRDLAMMLFHTLNGGFGLYKLTELQQEARSNEQYIVDSRSDENFDVIAFAEGLAKRVSKIKGNFISKLKELDSTLGSNFSSGEVKKEFSKTKIEDFYQRLIQTYNTLRMVHPTASAVSTELAEGILYFEREFIKIPVKDFIMPYEELCQKTADKIGKQMAPIEINGGDVLLNPNLYQEFFNVLIHLFRNSLDHGIESTSKREEKGKSLEGHIRISIKDVVNDKCVIHIADDGAGINTDKVREKLKSLAPELDTSKESDEEIVYHIFDPFFSTKDEVSELSGRGVGMSAIKEVVDRMNGKIIIKSIRDKGTTFIFDFR